MPTRAFFHCDAVTILARVRAAAEPLAGVPLVVHVGEERDGYRNVGLTLPRVRRTRLQSRNLRIHLLRALEAIGVVSAPCARAPRVEGDLVGSVQVREVALAYGYIQPAM